MSVTSILASVARLAGPRFVALIRGSADEQAEQVAVAKAAGCVAIELLGGDGKGNEERTDFVASALLEAIGRADRFAIRALRPGTARLELQVQLEACLAGLDDPEVGLSALGIEVPSTRVAAMFVEQLTDNLLLWGAKGGLMRDLGLQLQLERLIEAREAAQAAGRATGPEVRAWITIESDPPQIEVYNDSDAPIFHVVPTPLLIAKDLAGAVVAMVGGGSFANTSAAQISPGYGYVWPLPHMATWSGQPLVYSQLHLEYTDITGARWALAHGTHVAQQASS